MTFTAFAFIYLVGGLTFIPLALAAVLIPAWFLLPRIAERSSSTREDGGKADGEDSKAEIAQVERQADTYAADGATSGTFAVLRRYDFQAATVALNAKSSSGNVAGNVGGTDGAVEASNGSSESVYQSMYRSVFDRSKNPATGNAVLQTDGSTEGAADGKTKKKIATPANVFHIELRHGHLMLYDSPRGTEVRHVISLAHHSVSISEGGIQEDEEANIKDGELFIKRTAIVLTPLDLPNGGLQSHSAPPKPFFLFSATCIEKEEFYHALLYARTHPPVPKALDTDDMIKLQSALHSTILTAETRAFNALVSRIFFAIYHTDRAKDFIQARVEKKISRVQKPAFIASVDVQAIDLGDAAPIISNLRLKDLNIGGDMTLAFDIKYTGAMSLTVSALAKLDLGPRFKTRTVTLVLASSLQRLQGHMLVRIKPPPSNRIWFCFEQMPDMEIKVEPVVSQRQITYTFILRAIEERIRTVIGETLVKPNWDDIAFFDTRGQHLRGGIWQSEGDEQEVEEPAPGEMLKARNEKTMSMPVLNGVDADSSATSSSSEATPQLVSRPSTSGAQVVANEHLKRRSVASLPPTLRTPSSTSDREPARPPKPLRSPSLTAPTASAPSIALDESSANFEPSRAQEARTPPQRAKTWRMRPTPQPPQARKDAVEAMREMRDKSLASSGTESEPAVAAEMPAAELSADDEEEVAERRLSDTAASRTAKRSETTNSTANSSASSSEQQQRKQTILAATAAATSAARNWSWNALQNARTKGNSPRGPGQHFKEAQHQPMGRGQPLPPPGTPLPGPPKGLFGAMGSLKRKPVPPPRPSPTASSLTSGKSSIEVETKETHKPDESDTSQMYDKPEITTPTSEFGPWRQNSGLDEDAHGFTGDTAGDVAGDAGVAGDNDDLLVSEEGQKPVYNAEADGKKKTRNVAPPLPPRRNTAAQGQEESVDAEDINQVASVHESQLLSVPSEKQAGPAKIVEGQHTRRIEDSSEHEQKDVSDGHESISDLVAIPAPVEDEEKKDGVGEVNEALTGEEHHGDQASTDVVHDGAEEVKDTER